MYSKRYLGVEWICAKIRLIFYDSFFGGIQLFREFYLSKRYEKPQKEGLTQLNNQVIIITITVNRKSQILHHRPSSLLYYKTFISLEHHITCPLQ